jgi:hypothetical protein
MPIMEESASSYDLFISYRHSVDDDAIAVRVIASQLHQKGLNAFLDERRRAV